MSRVRLGSLFAGIGGFDLAAERVGFQTAWQSEIEPFAVKVLAKRFPGAVQLGDVTTVDATSLPPVDVVTFGSPCQDLSVAGLRRGLGGERSGLFFEAIRIITDARPRFAIWENVPGAYSSADGRDFGAALDALADSGAVDIAWRCLDAQFFGVAQRRRRVFVVADFGGQCAGQVLFEPASGGGHPAPGREAGQDPAARAEDGAGVVSTIDASYGRLQGASLQDLNHGHSHLIAFDPTQITSRTNRSTVEAGGACPTLHQGGTAHVARALTSHPDDQDATVDTYVLDGVAGTLGSDHGNVRADQAWTGRLVAGSDTASHGHHGFSSPRGDGSDTLIAFDWQASDGQDTSWRGKGRQHVVRSGDKAGTVSSTRTDAVWQGGSQQDQVVEAEGVSPTLAHSSNTHGGHYQPKVMGGMGVRRLMPVECERLQGFPDGWTCLHDHPQQCDCPDGPRYRALGNAVCVNVAQWILNRVAYVLMAEREAAA